MSSFAGFGTSALHVGQEPEQWGMMQVVPPISVSTTYKEPSPGQPVGHCYSRDGNPTRDVLEANLAALEGAKYCATFASGTAASSSILNLLSHGDHIVCSEDLYAGTLVLVRKQAVARHGIQASFVDFTKEEDVEAAFRSNTKMVWFETCSNPLLKVVDIQAIVAFTRKISPEIIIVVDNTFMTPYFQNPLSMGVDIVMHSLTKYINGHSDVLMGAVITNCKEVKEQMHFQQNAVGSIPSPFDCFLVNRGVKTLHIRMKTHFENALLVAQYLENSDRVEKVLYPALPSHPQHEVYKKQSKGMSGMVTFYIKGGAEEAKRFFSAIKVFTLAESLGGVESLANLSSKMTHATLSAEERTRLGITDNLIRLSVGIEDKEDIINDLDQALKAAVQH